MANFDTTKSTIIDVCTRELFDKPIFALLRRRDVYLQLILQEAGKPTSCTIHLFMDEEIITRRVGSGNAQSVYLDLPSHLEDAITSIQVEIEETTKEQNLIEAYLTRTLNTLDTRTQARNILPSVVQDMPKISALIDTLPGYPRELFENTAERKLHAIQEQACIDMIKTRLLTNLLIRG